MAAGGVCFKGPAVFGYCPSTGSRGECGESVRLGTTLQWQSLKLRLEMSWALK